MKITTAVNLIKKNIENNGARFITLVGESGIGKTFLIEKMCRKLDVIFLEFPPLSLAMPEDLLGIPRPTKDEKTFYYLSYEKIFNLIEKSKEENKKLVIFFDELNRANTEVQNALLKIISDLRVGEIELPRESFFVGAMNPENYAGVSPLTEALKNRALFLKVEADLQGWLQYVSQKYGETFTQKFLQTCPKYFSNIEEYKTSPRLWEEVIKIELALGVENVQFFLKDSFNEEVSVDWEKFLDGFSHLRVLQKLDKISSTFELDVEEILVLRNYMKQNPQDNKVVEQFAKLIFFDFQNGNVNKEVYVPWALEFLSDPFYEEAGWKISNKYYNLVQLMYVQVCLDVQEIVGDDIPDNVPRVAGYIDEDVLEEIGDYEKVPDNKKYIIIYRKKENNLEILEEKGDRDAVVEYLYNKITEEPLEIIKE